MPSLPPQLKDWVPVAHQILHSTAAHYQQTITHGELAELVQERSGVRTEARPSTWMPALLDVVALHAHDSGEPPLTSLAVRRDGTVGDGYARAAAINGTTDLSNLDERAAEHRLACYQAFAADLPADGGRPMLTPQLERKREKVVAAAKAEGPRYGAACPTCFVQLPLSGICDTCD